MAYNGSSAYDEERKKNQQTQFGLGYTTNTGGAEGKSNPKPKNKIGSLIRPKTQAERDRIPTRKTTPKPKMSRNEQNLRRRQGR